MKTINASITISRPQNGDGQKYIRIEVKDESSRTRFLTLKIGLEDFSEAITGLSGIKCTGEVMGLENVGKTKEVKHHREMIPSWVNPYNRSEQQAYLETISYDDDWLADTYIGSQGSVVQNTDPNTNKEFPVIANIRLYRYN